MDYREARAYIEEAWKYAGEMGLSTTENLLEELGNPQDELEFIHIGGTNGKGSVASFIATVLQEAGYKIGRYISPTVYSYRERIQINGEYISREDFVKYVEQISEAVSRMEEQDKGHPSPFEMETAISFLYFRDRSCDLVVLECGMGGRDDATNVIKRTRMAVLTSISLDHVGVLGSTLQEIAKNKAGIIKPGAIVVTGKQSQEVEETLWAICTEKGNPFIVAKPQEATLRDLDVDHQTFRYHGDEITIGLAGSHQIENAALALECIRALAQVGFNVKDDEIREGFLKTRWDGRFTILDRNPFFVVDGAHNPDAANKLKESIQAYFPNNKRIFIMGMFRDKDYRRVAELMAPMAEKIFTVTPPDSERGLPAAEFAETIREFHADVTACDSFSQAVENSYQEVGEDCVIIAFGSLSFIAEITKLVKDRTKRNGDSHD